MNMPKFNQQGSCCHSSLSRSHLYSSKCYLFSTRECTLNYYKEFRCTYVVIKAGKRFSDPSTATVPSGKVPCSGKQPTSPLVSTWIGYLRRCPCNGVKSLAVYFLQLSSAILFTLLMQAKSLGSLKQSSISNIPKCSAHSDILNPYICKYIDQCGQLK